MRLHLYTICWNENRLLGFFFRHYDPWVERYIVYDDGSQDGTLDQLRGHPKVEVRPFPRVRVGSYVESAKLLHNSMWKESRGAADWVIISAIDEHLFHPDFGAYLERCASEGVTLIPALGYQMLTTEFPDPGEHLSRTRTIGAPFWEMNKLCIFNPDALAETNFHVGRHRAQPVGRLELPERDELLNLHYKYLGLDYVRQRHQMLAMGLGPEDRARRYGHQYDWPETKLIEEIGGFRSQAIDLADPTYCPGESHPAPRWWRLSEGRSHNPRFM